MKNIGIITPGLLPIPSVKGGAIESIIQNIVDVNEKNYSFNFTVFTVSTKESFEKENDFLHTRFFHIKRCYLYDCFVKKINPIFHFICKTFKLKALIRLNFSYSRKVLKKINDNFDIIIVEGNYPILKKLRKKVNCKIYYHNHWNDINNKIDEFDKNYFRTIFSKIDLNISVSDFISKNFEEVIDNVRNTTLKNCLSNNWRKNIDNREINLSQIEDFSQYKKVFAYVGRLSKEKGIKELIISFSNAKKFDCCLLIIGGANYSNDKNNDFTNELHEIAKKSSNKIIFLNYIDYEKLPIIYQNIDVGIIPTLTAEESFSMVSLEFASKNIPLIASDSGAILENVSLDSTIVIKRDSNFINNLTRSIDLINQDENFYNNLKKNAEAFNNILYEDEYFEKIKELLK